MMTCDEIEKVLIQTFPGGKVTVEDLTGTSDHFEVRVSSPEFRGKSLIEQHRKVHDALAVFLEDGRIHALKIKTTLGTGP